jgi:peptide-methionine (S)-S-oxide reductase
MSQQKASFAAGCFWGVEARFLEVEGVVDAVSGYMGGHVDNPTYKQICSAETGHAEAVEVTFDDEQVSYGQLLDVFFEMHNPTTLNRQGPDFGSQYRSSIYWFEEEQEAEAAQKISDINASGKWQDPVVTELARAPVFWRAEEYHQRYFEKNGAGYCHV